MNRLPPGGKQSSRFGLKPGALAPSIVAVVFFLSRLLYYQAGIRFQGETYLTYWQFISPDLLTTDLWRSILYLHGQPPLMNLLTGLILILFPSNHAQIFQIIFILIGLVTTLSMYFLGVSLGLPRWPQAMLTIWFAISPATILYENWLFYTYPLTGVLCLGALSLFFFLRTRNLLIGFLSFFLILILPLTWSLFHLVWLLSIALLLMVFSEHRRRILIISVIPVLMLTAWYAKNAALFGTFTSSSWAGMNMAKITTFRLPTSVRRTLVQEGHLSRLALQMPFSNPEVYVKLLPPLPVTGNPLLDRTENRDGSPNMNQAVYIGASRLYFTDALWLVRSDPLAYIHGIGRALYCYFHSSSDNEFLNANSSRISTLVNAWDVFFYGQVRKGEDIAAYLRLGAPYYPDAVAWLVVIVFLCAVLFGLFMLARQCQNLPEPIRLSLLFIWWNIVYVAVVGNLFDLGENNRFRFVVDPLMYTLAFWAVFQVFSAAKHKTPIGQGASPQHTDGAH